MIDPENRQPLPTWATYTFSVVIAVLVVLVFIASVVGIARGEGEGTCNGLCTSEQIRP